MARREKLSDSKIDKLPIKAKRYFRPDPEQEGGYVRVAPDGGKAYYVQARDPYHKQVWKRIESVGESGVIGIIEARKRGSAAIDNIKAGRPAVAPPLPKPDTFKSVAEDFVKRHVEANKLRSKREIGRILNKYVYPTWGERPFIELRRSDVTRLLDHVEDTHGARQADMVLAIIRKVTHWFQARHDDYVSPVVRGMGRTKPADRKGKRILVDGEIRAVWKAAGAAGTFGAMVKMLILTGQRREKVATMRWDDLIDGEWHIPSEAREKSNAGTLRLPQMVLDIIEAQDRIEGNPYVFHGRGKRHFNSWSQRKAELDEKLPDMPHWILHDLRRSARSLMSRAGVRPDIAERVLGHAIAGVEGVYDRHAYTHEKADALNRLAHLVETILNPPAENVVQLAEATQ